MGTTRELSPASPNVIIVLMGKTFTRNFEIDGNLLPSAQNFRQPSEVFSVLVVRAEHIFIYITDVDEHDERGRMEKFFNGFFLAF